MWNLLPCLVYGPDGSLLPENDDLLKWPTGVDDQDGFLVPNL